MVLKFPPPPFLAKQDPDNQRLNRWLIEIQNILNNAGEIDPGSIAGLAALTAQVAANTSAITTLQGQMTTANANITTLQGQMTTANTNIANLQARAQVLNGIGVPAAGTGNTNDWYADTSNKHIYVKTAPGTWTLIV